MRLVEQTPPEKRWLILDVENGPSWGWGPDGYTYSQVFCVAWKWLGDTFINSMLLDWRKSDYYLRAYTAGMWADLALADGFIGHNFAHDKGLLVATAKDIGAPLPDLDKPLIDTMRSVPASSGAMRSLEALCSQFELGEKPHIDTYTWKKAWVRWDRQALGVVRRRCKADVRLTEALYLKEKEIGWL